MTDKANFLLACSGLIPLLSLTLFVELRIYDGRARAKDRWRVVALGAFLLIGFGLASVAEYRCLHGLEDGRISRGSLHLIWQTLYVQAAAIFGALFSGVTDAWPARSSKTNDHRTVN